MEKDNYNNWVVKEGLDKWHKIDKEKFTPPPLNSSLVLFTKSGSVYSGVHSSRGFIVYGINHKELEGVEVTHWRILTFPDEFQKLLDDMEENAQKKKEQAKKQSS